MDGPSFSRRVLAASIALLVSAGCDSNAAPQSEGSLAEAAARAKAARRSATVVTVTIDENGSESPLQDLAYAYSIVLAEPQPVLPVQTVTSNWIRTWHVLRVTSALIARQPSPADGCGEIQLPTSLTLSGPEVAVPLLAGTATVNGVSITLRTGHELVKFNDAPAFLLMGHRCPSGVFILPQGELDVFQVDANGHLQFRHSSPRFPFLKEVLQLGTVDALRLWLRDNIKAAQ